MGQKLLDLIDGYPMADVTGTLDRDISSIAYDSRKVEPEGLFVAMPGHHHDGGRFIGQAIEKQAGAFVTEMPQEQIAEAGFQIPASRPFTWTTHGMCWPGCRTGFTGAPRISWI